jgi:uncharacterized protein
VNDYARLLPADARQRLESRLAEREHATGTQMVLAIFPSLEGENLEDVGIRVAERWRVGDKKLDTGVILLVFVQERRVRMEVGYGLEPVLPDAVAAQIIREAIGPRFREQRYAAGLEAAVDAVYARVETRGAPGAARDVRSVPPPPRHGLGVSPWTLGVLAIFGVIALVLAREVRGGRARRHGYTAGGRRGWDSPSVIVPPIFGGWGRGGGGHDSGSGGFSAGGGSFGGGGASGEW